MELNDKQREVLQAILDGKNVSYRFDSEPFQKLTLGAGYALVSIGVSNDIEYRIEEPGIRVALFRYEDKPKLFSFTEESMQVENKRKLSAWKRVSDWVEIQPIKE